jgi:hypothetical protein
LSEAVINIADLSIDVEKRQVGRGGMVIDLTRNEFDLLRVMAENPDAFSAVCSCWTRSRERLTKVMSGPLTAN